jgi:hypothetical protein
MDMASFGFMDVVYNAFVRIFRRKIGECGICRGGERDIDYFGLVGHCQCQHRLSDWAESGSGDKKSSGVAFFVVIPALSAIRTVRRKRKGLGTLTGWANRKPHTTVREKNGSCVLLSTDWEREML